MAQILLRRIEFEFNSLQTQTKQQKPHGHIEHTPQLSTQDEQALRKLLAQKYSEHKQDRIRIFRRGKATVIKIERNNEQRRRRRDHNHRKELR